MVHDELIIWDVCIVKRLNVLEDLLDLFNSLGRPDPELALGALQALGLDVFYLYYSEISLFSPLELLVQKVEHGEVEGPHVVASGQINVVMGVQTGE